MMAKKLKVEQGISFFETLTSLSDDNITLIINLYIRPGDKIGARTLDRRDYISKMLVVTKIHF